MSRYVDSQRQGPSPRPMLPRWLTTFVGRERELAALQEVLAADATRLLTLTGPGGVGKTRLALQIAADSLYAYPDGVWFVPLSLLRDSAAIPSTVARVVGAVTHSA